IQRDPDITYPITIAYPDTPLITNPNPPANRIAVCTSCKTNPTCNYPPYLCQIPPEINSVPLENANISAYLSAPTSNRSTLPPWFDNSISNAINWLKENNLYLHEYSQLIPTTINQFPSATHSFVDENTPQIQHNDIIVPH
ncbi:22126_t:CDS:2, partial [Gigaspora rosea]